MYSTAISIHLHIPPRRQLITPAERRVLEMVAAGLTNHQIAQALGVTANTVSLHRSKLMRKLAIRSPAELRRFAQGYVRTKSGTPAGA